MNDKIAAAIVELVFIIGEQRKTIDSLQATLVEQRFYSPSKEIPF